MNIIIPICGVGNRFKEDNYILPKPLIKVLGKPMLFWNLENLNPSKDDLIHIIYRSEFELFNFEDIIKNEFPNYNFSFKKVFSDTRGAAETVLFCLDEWPENKLREGVLILDSDNFYKDDIIEICKTTDDNLIFYTEDTTKNPIFSYIKTKNNLVFDIVEKEKISDLVCVGAYKFKNGEILKNYISKILIDNYKDKKEFYISTIYKKLLNDNVEVKSFKIENFTCLGTPNQLKSFSSNFNNSEKKLRFCFDLDNTLVSYPEIKNDYSTVKPITRTINFLNFLKSKGHYIIIHTARRMRTHNGNVEKVKEEIEKLTLETLKKFNIQYDEIVFGKPYANFYIDDLSVRPYEDLEKETGIYNIHPDTRKHNRIEIFDNHIIKYSESIDGEKNFYLNIPNEVKNYFPKILGYGENFIKISKINGIPLSFLYSNKTLSQNMITKVLFLIKKIHDIKISEDNKKIKNLYENYLPKYLNRVKNYDYSSYEDFEKINEEIIHFLKEYENSDSAIFGVTHGDPVFTNILIDVNDEFKLIDMRGGLGDELSIYGDIFYDYAKIYQSIIGYDFILNGKKIDYNYIQKNKIIFEKFILEFFSKNVLEKIKNITKSLIITLIPLHDNDKCLDFYKLIKNI